MAGKTTDASSVWRYMSFGRFVWMLEKKMLWMTRVDRLDDFWEMRYSEAELAAQADDLSAQRGGDGKQIYLQACREVYEKERGRTFVNCWTVADGESHAMWTIFCASPEGVCDPDDTRKAEGFGGSARRT
jgi:hypothetical protein